MLTDVAISQAARAMADFRKSRTPAVKTPGWREVACPGCGHVYAYRTGKKKPDCPDCAAERATSAADQLRDKAGPFYERYVRRQLEHWLAESERLGL